jgi:hypothetical protein
MKATSMKGVVVDMGRYLAQNENAVAIGNGRMNARGDEIGRGGQVIVSRDASTRDYYEGRSTKTVSKVSLNDLSEEVYVGPVTQAAAATEFQDPAAAWSDAVVADKAARAVKRKIQDTDN